jgi:hypothetical protein
MLVYSLRERLSRTFGKPSRTFGKPSRDTRKIIKELSKDVDTYKITCEIVPLDNTVLSDIFDKCSEKPLSTCSDIICESFKIHTQALFDKLSKEIDSARRSFCCKKMEKLCKLITSSAESLKNSSLSVILIVCCYAMF